MKLTGKRILLTAACFGMLCSLLSGCTDQAGSGGKLPEGGSNGPIPSYDSYPSGGGGGGGSTSGGSNGPGAPPGSNGPGAPK